MSIYDNTPVYEPGSPRHRSWGGYDTWGSVEDQVKEAQRHNLESTSSFHHTISRSYYMECDCVNPDTDDKYADVEELVEDWLLRNCGFIKGEFDKYPIKSPEWQMYYKNWKRACAAVPLYAEYEREQADYDENHPSGNGVCLRSPSGYFCEACQEPGWEDSGWGVEEGGCWIQDRAKENYGEFWYLFSQDRKDYDAAKARRRAEMGSL